MSANSNAPVIIKKVKKCTAGGHHGGAWKVAYADFVTAMMAFFMLMWLLNATTEKQRKGLADYFSPTIPIMRVSGGGEGAFGGDSVFIEETLAHTGHGGVPSRVSTPESGEQGAAAGAEGDAAKLEDVEAMLVGNSGESMVSDLMARHIITELSDEGLIIELFDILGDPLFVGTTDEPAPVLETIIQSIAKVVSVTVNDIAIDGYVAAQPIVVAEKRTWDLSARRADRVRLMLETAGIDRVQRVTGHSDRTPVVRNPLATRNNRIEIILLRSKL